MTNGGAEGGLLRAVAAVAWIVALAVLVPGVAVAHPDIDVVIQEVDRMVAAKPGDPDLLMHQAQVRKRAGNWDGALASLTQALAHGADADAVAATRGSVYLEAGFPRMARLQYDTVLAHRPDAYDMLFERGRAELALGHLDAADRDFARAIGGMSAPRPEHVALRAATLRSRGLRAEALAALDAGMARLGTLPSLALGAVDLEVELQRYDRALTRLDTLLAQTPTNAAWITRRAEILTQAHRTDEARAELARALRQLEAQPPHRRSQANTALAERLRGELATASPQKEGHL